MSVWTTVNRPANSSGMKKMIKDVSAELHASFPLLHLRLADSDSDCIT